MRSRSHGHSGPAGVYCGMSNPRPLRLVVVGDSIAYGTGARRVEETVGPRLAQALALEGYAVDVQVVAVPGATSRALASQVRRAVWLDPDLALIVVGANDLTRFVPPAQAAATEAAGGVVAPVSAELARAFAVDPKLYSADRFHPSSAGYARIADVLAPYVLAAARSRGAVMQPD